MTDWRYDLVPVADDRVIEVLVREGDEGARGVLWFTGTPGGAIPDEDLAVQADRYGLQLIQPLRPGYGQSSPRPGRRVVDFVEDVDRVLQHYGVTEVITLGASGGGPHSLAMAAALPQCRASGVLVTVAPRDAEDLDFYDGMALSNQEEWRLADQGEGAVRPWLEKAASDMHPEEGTDGVVDLFGDSISAVDRQVMETSAGANLSARFAKAIEAGIEGWLEDDLALTTPWGFDPAEVARPVTFWTGKQDYFVSYKHTVWLAERVPAADLHVFAEHGHLSLRPAYLNQIVDDLVRRAAWL
jgi:pimeloyl-ACP methyl ester carboxylesterase